MPANLTHEHATGDQPETHDPGATFGLYLLAGAMCLLVALLFADLVAALFR